jgi:uncharacterized membrane protein
VFALANGVYWYAVICLALFMVSFDFHFFREAKEVYYLDVIFSSLLILSNFFLLFEGHWKLPFSAISIIFALIALFFYFLKSKRNYYMNHSLWHIFSAGICIFCLVTFILAN